MPRLEDLRADDEIVNAMKEKDRKSLAILENMAENITEYPPYWGEWKRINTGREV
jgi:hypothetical protein